MSQSREPKLPESDVPESAVRRKLLTSFGWFALAAAVPVGVYEWITRSPKSMGARKPFRQVLDANEQIAKTYFSNTHLVPTFPVNEAVKKARVNGYDGIKTPIPDDWKLQIDRNTGTPPLLLTIDDIKALPRHELAYEFKCIEGWSQIQHWGGTRLSDVLAAYKLGTRSGNAPASGNTDDLFKHVGLETPDKGYYVGIDMESAMHPQTLLAYELNGQPITAPHGAPLRLIIPVKYGVKNLKRIGRIFFSDERPRDFWAERGYDYYVGL
ncbi:molybdopterin-dependent oxidoreductase [Spirosoma utsteinense]|uniref:DMSO/TMAO reductase YedYZ molybdopterin-dependent catalytic subunit n=1 Tax=Spirosoma utsteinense TaxID=2585773 RepID=A0ABR6W6X7_9BACT|nr:molybdopterin-dependent oxidoreductase [Spirosoma utsteinense]MBC3786126.1 DMSO/TMAO reductase YedYZ molybdopterin-dependent catalytic subunit [Spirosoma utsteinense]MBC3792315.1 DMSO/TMAO reductase YedYZ molybdopterin-dependent catalytic subunit [Spirosoma utsteinense]